jgi:hypothetical protein
MNQRAFDRAELHVDATMHCAERAIPCRVENVSLQGMYLRTDQPLPSGSKVALTIELRNQADRLLVECDGTVVRDDPGGVGLHIDSQGLESFIHWKNLVAHASGDMDALESQFAAFLGRRAE